MADARPIHHNPLPRLAELTTDFVISGDEALLSTVIRLGTETISEDKFEITIGLNAAVLEVKAEGFQISQHGRLGEPPRRATLSVEKKITEHSSQNTSTGLGASAALTAHSSSSLPAAQLSISRGKNKGSSSTVETTVRSEAEVTSIVPRGGDTWDIKSIHSNSPITATIGLGENLCSMAKQSANRHHLSLSIWTRKRDFTVNIVDENRKPKERKAKKQPTKNTWCVLTQKTKASYPKSRCSN